MAAMKADPNRLAAIMFDVQYLERNFSEALFTGGRETQRRKVLRKRLEQNNLKLTFVKKHLITVKPKSGSITLKDLKEQTAENLEKELDKLKLGVIQSVRTMNTIIWMTPEQFEQAVATAR